MGKELVSNGGFAANTTGWSGASCDLASVADGVSGNCLRITRTAGATQTAFQTVTPTEGLHQLSGWVKSGSSGAESFVIYVFNATEGTQAAVSTGTTSDTWTYYSNTFSATAVDLASVVRVILKKNSATAGTMLFDEISLTTLDCSTPTAPTVPLHPTVGGKREKI